MYKRRVTKPRKLQLPLSFNNLDTNIAMEEAVVSAQHNLAQHESTLDPTADETEENDMTVPGISETLCRHAACHRNNEVDNSGKSKFVWDIYEASPSIKLSNRRSVAKVLRVQEVITSYFGLIGINLIRVWKCGEQGALTFFGHYWNIMKTQRNFTYMLLFGFLIPIALNMIITIVPLYTLTEPVGDESFLPFSKIWGWLLLKSIQITVVDMIIISMQMIYLAPHDHFYFSIWPTAAKILATLLLQDFIPRTFNAFPFPLIDNLIGPLFCGVVVGYHCFVFVNQKLPDYERGIAEPTCIELLLSGGRSTYQHMRTLERLQSKDARKRLSKKVSVDTYEETKDSKEKEYNFVGKWRRNSWSGDTTCLSDDLYLPSYIVYQRRRLLVLVLLIGNYCVFYANCVAFLLFFRLTAGRDSLQALIAILFTSTSALFRKVITPIIFRGAQFGGPFWDGAYSTSFKSPSERFDDRVNASGFRMADFFFESLSEVFLTFILPEITSGGVFALLIVGEIGVVLFTAGSWILVVPGWKSITKSRKQVASVSPEIGTTHYRKSCSTTLNARGNDCHSCKSLAARVAGIPPHETVTLLSRKILTENQFPYVRRNRSSPQSREVQAASLSNSQLRQLLKRSGTHPVERIPFTKTLKRPKVDAFTVSHEMSRRWLVPLLAMKSDDDTAKHIATKPTEEARESPILDNGDLARLKQNYSAVDRNFVLPILDDDDLARFRQDHSADNRNFVLPILDNDDATRLRQEHLADNRNFDYKKPSHNWYVTSPDEEFALLGWAIARCQTLFIIFLSDLYTSISFLFLFTFMVFGYNSESFPYSEICSSHYSQIMQYNAVTFAANFLAICLSDVVVRSILGISLISSGMALYSDHKQSIAMLIISVLSYALVWGFIADHNRSMLFLSERFGALATAGGDC